VEYRGIRYTVRARIERNEWAISIHPAGIEGARRVVTGPRERAELLARSMIDRWRAAKRSEPDLLKAPRRSPLELIDRIEAEITNEAKDGQQ
jgi:hypothetical protein